MDRETNGHWNRIYKHISTMLEGVKNNNIKPVRKCVIIPLKSDWWSKKW